MSWSTVKQSSFTLRIRFRTAIPALPFKVLADLKRGKSNLARPERFELPTLRFEA